MSQSRQLAAIMFTDIVGYTALMGKDSAKALELVRISKEIQKPLVEKHHGQWLKEMGDGALVKFGTALDAVNCAIEIQEIARGKLDAKLRIGIHSGDITIENNDVYGDGVNVASRLESIADPGGIYISESIEKAFQGQTDVQAKYLGEIKLKNVAYGVRTYAVQGVGLPIPEVKKDKELSGHFLAEVQRRGVIQAVATYVVLSLLLILLLPYANSLVNLPTWSSTALLGILIAGFPAALYLAWNYERSPEGFVKTTSQQSWQNPYTVDRRKPFTGRFVIMGLVLLIIIMYFYPQFLAAPAGESGVSDEVTITDKSIAVLPFKNDSPDADNQYFADGMMDEILNHLQKIAELGVKSRTAVEPYRNSTQGFSTIAEELGVAFVLEGAVRKYGDRFRVTTQLIEVESGNHLWSDTYDGTFSDTIFVVQSNIAKKIAASLNTVITTDEEKSIDRIPTTDIAAYDFWVRASHERNLYWSTFDNKHLKTAHDLLDKALKIDPDYLKAMIAKGYTFSAERNYDSVLVYADRVIGLAPDLNMGYGLAGSAYMWTVKTDLAIEYYLKAIELPPQDGSWRSYHSAIGRGYLRYNEVVKALPYLKKGLENSDEESNAGPYYWIWAAYTNIGDYEKAAVYGRKAAELGCYGIETVTELLIAQGKFRGGFQFADSTCHQVQCESVCFHLLFRTSYLLGEYQNAEQYYLQWRNVEESIDLNAERLRDHEIGYVYYQLGRTEEAKKIFEEQIKRLELDNDNITTTEIYLARIYAFIGEKYKALTYLKQFTRNRGFGGLTRGWHDFILIDPFFESLRDDPEFKAIIKQAQDEKAALRAQVREMEERGELDL